MLYAPLLLCFVLLALSRFLCALHFIFRTLSALQLVCICRSFCSVLFSCALCFRLLALVLPAFLRLALLFYLFRFSRIFLCSFLARFHLALHLFSLFSVFSLALLYFFFFFTYLHSSSGLHPTLRFLFGVRVSPSHGSGQSFLATWFSFSPCVSGFLTLVVATGPAPRHRRVTTPP